MHCGLVRWAGGGCQLMGAKMKSTRWIVTSERTTSGAS